MFWIPRYHVIFTQKLISFFKLSSIRKRMFFRVICLSVYQQVLKMSNSPRAYSENLVKDVSRIPVNLSTAQLLKIGDVAAAIELGRKYIPWKNLCRHQAWQAIMLLQREGITFTYHTGIKKESPNRNEGHAWVMVNGRFVSGKCRLSEYREVKFQRSGVFPLQENKTGDSN